MATHPARIAFLVSYDEDDASMTPEVIAEAEKAHPSVICVRGKSKTKIEAINADVADYAADWDIVLVISDDFFCRRQGWDEVVRKKMETFFPDTDGSLWFWDGAQRKINTLPCLGRKYWEALGRNIYRPEYGGFFCDNEQTHVGIRDKKLVFIEQSLASHEHPSWLKGMKNDETYQRNNRFWNVDQATFSRRLAAGFPP